jgi:hypothetical protein
MERKSLLFATLLFFSSGGYAQGACTVEDVQARHQEFMNAAVVFAQTDPKKYEEVALALQKELPPLLEMKDLDRQCSFYEEWTQKMQ